MNDNDGIHRGSLYERVVRDLQSDSRDSLTQFLQQFRNPISAFLLTSGHEHPEAAHEFDQFARGQMTPPTGRLRTCLLTSLAAFHEPTSHAPANAFNREWAAVVHQASHHAVERDYLHRGRAKEFRLLSRSLSGAGKRFSPAELAHHLRIREPQLRQKLLQLTQRFRHSLHNHIAQTTSEAETAAEFTFVSERINI